MDRASRSRLARLAIFACSLLAISVAPAQAAVVVSPLACPTQAFSPVFAAWGDFALYTPAPGGNFEASAGWTLAGGATVATGNSPFAKGTRSLSLPAGASALSPPICVQKNYPSWRFATRSSGGALGIEILYPAKTKDTRTLSPSALWALTPVLTFSTGQFDTGPTTIRIRFTAAGAAVRADDVYIDPRLRR
jgi:hypothetical protein